MMTYSRSPFEKITSQSTNANVASKCLDKIIGPHDLVSLDEQEPLKFNFEGSVTEKMVIGILSYGKDVIFKTQPSQNLNNYCITRPQTGTPVFEKNGEKFLATYQNATIVSPYDKFEIEIERNCVQSFLSFNKDFVESVLSDIIQKPIQEPLIFDNTMDIDNNPKILAWWDLLDKINTILLNFENDSFSEIVKRDFEYVLVKTLILSQKNNYTEQINNSLANIPEFLKRTLDYIQQNIKSNIDIDDLEKISGVSKQKLKICFKRYMGMSINSYIKIYRLKCINYEILNSTRNVNITYIALNWGIKHLGRFSKEYKDFFGESPSTTLKKILDHQGNLSKDLGFV